MSNEKYKLVLGLEIHMHLKTSKKMFCGCDANIYDSEPNTHTCPTCLGLPGALPVANGEAVRLTQLLGLALGCKLNSNSKFDRKHYFYPDLPKGYQISQYQEPLCIGTDGILERIHLEEDTAKSFHEGNDTLIDFNKSGMPLIEIVTKPVFKTAKEASDFARKLRDTAVFLGISEAVMAKGQMRIEPNISVRTQDMEEKGELPNYKVEVKNINSFKFMEKAVRFEFNRQVKILESGETPDQENRGYNESKNVTEPQRSKEEAHDYRYFPEPDIPPMVFDDDFFKNLKKSLPETPDQIKDRLIKDYSLDEQIAESLTVSPGIELLEEFELLSKEIDPEKVAKLLLNKIEFRGLSIKEFKKKIEEMEDTIDDKENLLPIVKTVIEHNPDPVQQYKDGKESVIQFLLGMVMRETKGKANPQIAIALLKTELSN